MLRVQRELVDELLEDGGIEKCMALIRAGSTMCTLQLSAGLTVVVRGPEETPRYFLEFEPHVYATLHDEFVWMTGDGGRAPVRPSIDEPTK
jgi:hypothetical protein